MVKQVRIISLGEVVTPNIMHAVQAFTSTIAKKIEAANVNEIGKAIGGVLQQNMHLINDFKLGALSENAFTEQMIAALEKVTGAKLSIEEFDQAWNTMNPKFEQFEALLKQAVEYNNQPKQQIVFISFTNPKDIRCLVSELEKNKQSYKIANDLLVEVNGISLHTTYATKQTKADLIEATIKQLNTKIPFQSALANSMSNLLSLEGAKESEQCEIKYIHGVNNLKDPILKEDLEKTNQEVEKKAAGFFVDTILWKKWEQPLLSEILNNNEIVSAQFNAAKL